MNDILLHSYVEAIVQRHQEISRKAEERRLIAEAPGPHWSLFSRLVRLPIGRAIVALGQIVEGRNASGDTLLDPGSSITLAR